MNKTRTDLTDLDQSLGLPLAPPGRTVIYHVCGRPGQNDRPALPSGHPLTWSMLTDGTALEGEPYPYPVFDLDP